MADAMPRGEIGTSGEPCLAMADLSKIAVLSLQRAGNFSESFEDFALRGQRTGILPGFFRLI
jgi:hypothetical protein